ncbi:hypothetical protein Glove_22g235 [Diversispora epigaea]|uniref:Uncharacterized protein n=1 Tax=Diversispora epigaea TaxID=1348612 RepID=A0A397JJM9_9GLOM|nr:hypothetical protein Glove_22g235 [Diversispora epigaea]
MKALIHIVYSRVLFSNRFFFFFLEELIKKNQNGNLSSTTDGVQMNSHDTGENSPVISSPTNGPEASSHTTNSAPHSEQI